MDELIIVGGSISGLAMAILLSRLGINVTVLERSSGMMNEQGAGIMLPAALIEKCIELDLFDVDIPRIPISGRTFSRKTNDDQTVKFWDQSLQGYALNWIDVYRNLQKRLNTATVHSHTTVVGIRKEEGKFHLKTASQTHYPADFVIAADGGESTIRKQCASGMENYSGYIGWRGTLEDSDVELKDRIQCYAWANGHILLYRIPAADYKETGKTRINWLIYEQTPRDLLPLRLTDNHNVTHTRSVPAKSMHETQRQYLDALAKTHFPADIASLVQRTTHPFIQVIHDFQIDLHPDDQLLFVGDAAATLRPHSASGVTKALSNAIELYRLLSANPHSALPVLFNQWKASQQKTNAEEVEKAKKMGDALIMNPPDWPTMDQPGMDAWWAKIMRGHTWFATQPSNPTSAQNLPLRAKL